MAETEKKMVEETLFYSFSIAMCMGLGALSIFVWAVLDNQMDDTEDIKYRVLEKEMRND